MTLRDEFKPGDRGSVSERDTRKEWGGGRVQAKMNILVDALV